MKTVVKERLLLYRIKTKRDKDAFAELYDNYVKKIYRFVYFKINNKEETEDLTSEVFLKVWRYLIENKEEVESFSGLIYQMARNLIIDFYRERAKKPTCSLEQMPEIVNENEKEREKIEVDYEVEKMLKLLRKMKQEYQEVILLKYVEGLSLKEIAGILNKSKTNTRVLLYRAMKKLKGLSEMVK